MMKSQQVDILLSTYNGEKYLSQLLDSLKNQSHGNWILWIRDDGSVDDTRAVCDKYAKTDHRVKIIQSSEQGLGASLSFAWLLAKEEIVESASYVLFCDQDDIWHPNKIEITLGAMLKAEANDPDLPLLVHTDLVVVDEELKEMSPSYWSYGHIDPKLNQLSRLLLQNTVTGCTAMINKRLIRLSSPIPAKALMHDWWIALVASAFGKIVPVYQPVIDYRQHNENVCGSVPYSRNIFKDFVISIREKMILKRKLEIVRKSFVQASVFLNLYGSRLNNKQFALIENFVSIVEVGFFSKRKIIISNGFYRQGFFYNLGLLLFI